MYAFFASGVGFISLPWDFYNDPDQDHCWRCWIRTLPQKSSALPMSHYLASPCSMCSLCPGPLCCPCQRQPLILPHSPPCPDGPGPWSDTWDSPHQRQPHRSAPATRHPPPCYSAQRIQSIFVNLIKFPRVLFSDLPITHCRFLFPRVWSSDLPSTLQVSVPKSMVFWLTEHTLQVSVPKSMIFWPTEHSLQVSVPQSMIFWLTEQWASTAGFSSQEYGPLTYWASTAGFFSQEYYFLTYRSPTAGFCSQEYGLLTYQAYTAGFCSQEYDFLTYWAMSIHCRFLFPRVWSSDLTSTHWRFLFQRV